MTHRFFRTADAPKYDAIRLQLDAAWGNEPPTTCITPAADAPRDEAGRIVLAVDHAFCDFPAVANVLPSLLASGAVEEIDEAAYFAAVNRPV